MIYLVRHGETDLNAEKKFYGSLDVSINQTGIAQAQQLKQNLAPIAFEKIYVSGLKRTKETATIINGSEGAPIIESAALNEKCFGLWEGLDANQIEARFPQEWQAWLDHPFEVNPPEAEAFSQFKNRVLQAFKQIISDKEMSLIRGNEQPLLIVGHLGVLRVMYQYLERESVFWDFNIPQGTFFVIPKELLWGK